MIDIESKFLSNFLLPPSKKIELKKDISFSTIKKYRITISIILLIFWIILLINLKSEIIMFTYKFLTLWGVFLTTIYFFGSILKKEEKLNEKSFFLHLILTMEICIFFGYWFFILPTGSIENEGFVKKFANFFVHFLIQVFLAIEFFINKSFFLKKWKYLFWKFLVFFCYTIGNIVLVKVFGDVPYRVIKWDSYFYVFVFFAIFLTVFLAWNLVLWAQRFKIRIKKEFKHDKDVKKHFLKR